MKNFLLSAIIHAAILAPFFIGPLWNIRNEIGSPEARPFNTELIGIKKITATESGEHAQPAPETESVSETVSDSASASVSSGHSIPDSYLASLRERIQSHLRYPINLKRRQITGSVSLKIQLGNDGEIRVLEIAQSSSHNELDDLALEAVKDSAPFPKPDANVTGKNLVLPIEFQIGK